MSATAERGAELRQIEAGAGAYRLTLPLAILTCALAPAYAVRWHVGFYPTTALEAGIVLTLVVFAWESWRQRRAPAWRSPFTLAAVLLVVAGAVSVVVAPDRRAALGLFRAYFIEPVLFFVVLITVIRTSRQAFMMVAGLAAGGTVVALLNIATVVDALRHHAVDTAQNAPVAIYQTSNAVALFLVPIIASWPRCSSPWGRSPSSSASRAPATPHWSPSPSGWPFRTGDAGGCSAGWRCWWWPRLRSRSSPAGWRTRST